METVVGKVPPHSVEAESAVLGAILLDRDAIHMVAPTLAPEDFYREAHRKIFRTMLRLAHHGDAIDLITLTEALRFSGELEEVGGAAYVSELPDRAVTAANVTHHARSVRERSTLRALGMTAAEIATGCYEPVPDVTSFVDEAEQAVFRVTERRAEQFFSRAGTLLRPALRKVEELYERQETITGVPSGFRDLDALTAGFQRSNLVIVAGRPSVGKTAFCLNVAEFASMERGIGVGIFSLEMSADELVLRVLCSQADVDVAAMRNGRLRRDDLKNLALAAGRIDDAPLYIDDSGGLTVRDLHARARRLARDKEAKLGLLIVDYLQLVRGPARSESREREIGEVSRSLKALAKELRIPVVALSQLNREIEKRSNPEPQLADLRDSGSIEQDADAILFLYRKPGQEVAGAEAIEVTAALKKHRNGPVGDVPLMFRPRLAKFESSSLALGEAEGA